jgi:hypothetical protein
LASECGIGGISRGRDSALVAVSHLSYERRGPDTTTPVDLNQPLFFQVVAADVGAHLEGAQVQPGDDVTGGDEGFGRLLWAEGAGAGPAAAVRRSASEAVNAQFRPAA